MKLGIWQTIVIMTLATLLIGYFNITFGVLFLLMDVSCGSWMLDEYLKLKKKKKDGENIEVA